MHVQQVQGFVPMLEKQLEHWHSRQKLHQLVELYRGITFPVSSFHVILTLMLVEKKQFQEVMNCFTICAHPVNEMEGASHV